MEPGGFEAATANVRAVPSWDQENQRIEPEETLRRFTRIRPIRACLRCSKLKIKCERPRCGPCSRSDSVCEYASNSRGHFQEPILDNHPTGSDDFGDFVKGLLVTHACSNCRQRKMICDNIKPQCTNCGVACRDCVYAMEDVDNSGTKQPPAFLKTTHKIKRGCFECRRHKMRCNRGKPQCQNCSRFKRDCVYVTESNSHYEPQMRAKIRPFSTLNTIRHGDLPVKQQPDTRSLAASDAIDKNSPLIGDDRHSAVLVKPSTSVVLPESILSRLPLEPPKLSVSPIYGHQNVSPGAASNIPLHYPIPPRRASTSETNESPRFLGRDIRNIQPSSIGQKVRSYSAAGYEQESWMKSRQQSEKQHQKFLPYTIGSLADRYNGVIEKPFVCNACGKAFAQKGDVAQHERFYFMPGYGLSCRPKVLDLSEPERERLPKENPEKEQHQREQSTEKQVQKTFRRINMKNRQSRLLQKLTIFMLWKVEFGASPPPELFSSKTHLQVFQFGKISLGDQLKGWAETYSGQEWNWWPFGSREVPLIPGMVRIKWKCHCGETRWADTSRNLAQRCQQLLSGTTAPTNQNNIPWSANSPATGSKPDNVSTSNHSASSFTSSGRASNIGIAATPMNIGADSNSYANQGLFILLCISQTDQIRHAQIEATKCRNDEHFFQNLRQEYQRLRGFWRHWLSPFQFNHCEFFKFTRFYVGELAPVGRSLPLDLTYKYNPRPPGPHEDPPISPHEFRRRYYSHLANPCGRGEALERIPKRQKRFQPNIHVDGREDMWGLHVELRPSFLMILLWQIAITAGGWAFMGWWLSRHSGDLQDAAVPVTLMITALMTLWVPLHSSMKSSS